nr:MAG TPA: hypothetical protein [Herelleviridae sp.]
MRRLVFAWLFVSRNCRRIEPGFVRPWRWLYNFVSNGLLRFATMPYRMEAGTVGNNRRICYAGIAQVG